MKKLLFLSVAVLALAATSCGNSGDSSASGKTSTSSANADKGANVENIDTASVKTAQPVKPVGGEVPLPNLSVNNAGNQNSAASPKNNAQTPKVTPRPETPTDKLLKQYNEAFVALIPTLKTGKLDEAANKKFLDLQSQLDQLDKNGQLSATQKELYKVTTDTYNKMKK